VNFLRYWIFVELAFSSWFILLDVETMRRVGKHEEDGKRQLPGIERQVLFILQYILKLLGVGVGTLLFISLVIMVERTIITFYKETSPAPSSVEIPANLGLMSRK